MVPVEQNQPNQISEIFAGLYRNQPLNRRAPEFSDWEFQVRQVSTDKQDYLNELIHVYRDKQTRRKGDSVLADIQIMSDRILLLIDIAYELGATEIEMTSAYFDALEENSRQKIFNVYKDNGFMKLSYEDVGVLMTKYGLEWSSK